MTDYPAMGLDGTIVARSRLGRIEAEAGALSFCGYDVRELADQVRWEEVLHLLWYGELPTLSQLATIQGRLEAERTLTPAELDLVRALPHDGHPMDVLRAAISLLAGLHKPAIASPATLFTDGMRLTAKLPLLLAAWTRLRDGREPALPPAGLSHAAACLYALHGARPTAEEEAAMNAYLVLLAEHGLNVSTFVARVVTSTQNDLYTAIDAALAALKGVAHGGANEHAMRAFLAIGSPERASAFVDEVVSRKGRLMGVGHRIYRSGDPRVPHLRRHSAVLAARRGAEATAHAVAEAVVASIETHPYFQARGLFPNVEFYSAPLLYQLGWPVDAFTAAFAVARMPGWVAHVGEQLAVPRLVRPEAVYVGPPARAMLPIAERELIS